MLSLRKKDKAYFYLDTHAGIGRYDLTHHWAEKNREFAHGIALLWQRKDIPASLIDYMQLVRAENPDGKLRFYPGSPHIARRWLRPGDRMVLIELNRDDCAALIKLFARDRQVHVQCVDAYQALKAFLPPPERRGMVLIDSSFDRANEFARIAAALSTAHKRWATGTYAVWYPLMEQSAMVAFDRAIIGAGIPKILKLDFALEAEDWTLTMRGCGMLVVNPPWKFDHDAAAMLEWLWRALSVKGSGGASVSWLVPE
ncbi:MAG: 23S rRNA (adenine(2030)-N(6))-methyltransferase RlmJ, partial [Burkholderiales bacterium]